MPLHELLAANTDAVMGRWKTAISGDLVPEAMAHVELMNHLPEFLQEIISVLRDDDGVGSSPDLDGITTAVGHGAQRLRLGFSLDAVVREYGMLRDAIIETARAAGVVMTFRELQVVFDCTVSGIAHAVTEYSHQRDAELMRQTNEHFAFIAHELRNPLSSAMLALHVLRNDKTLPASSRAAAALERGLQRTIDLVEETLKVARIASGVELRREKTSLRALFEESGADAGSEAQAKGIEIRTTVDSEDTLELDLRLVRSALGNLLRNAVKYSHAGGIVELRGTIANRRATIEVEDCCGGLPPGKVEEAFAPFVRFDNRQSGFGLGLAIAKQAVDAHGGTIRIQNIPGKGCMFVLDIPTGT